MGVYTGFTSGVGFIPDVRNQCFVLFYYLIGPLFYLITVASFFRSFFFSFLFKSSFLSLSFTYHPLHPPLSISPSLTRLPSEILLSID